MVNKLLNILGYKITNIKKEQLKLPGDFSNEHISIYRKVAPFTMTSKERVFAAIEAAKYLAKNKIGGAIVECGVWKGGSTMAILETLLAAGDDERQIYLYDTFEGMSEPTEADKTVKDETAEQLLSGNADKDQNLVWAYSPLEEVRRNVSLSGYNEKNIHYIKGKVEDTIPKILPGPIALLRLDTDWYESTKHELVNLFPMLVNKGVIIIDDYGHWQGARKAVDEYLTNNDITILLNRIDETGRIGIKQDQ